MARPTILNDKIIDAFEQVLTEGLNAFILTDEELVILVNEELLPEDRFSYSAFKDWKAFALDKKEDTSPENLEKYLELGSLIKRALIKQKQSLFKKLESEPQWQKYAWILERKFSEWNLKHISEVKDDYKDRIERIVAKGEEIANKYGGITPD